jgi:hypothetical protein
MQMRVKDFLSGDFPIREKKVHALATKHSPLSGGDSLPESSHVAHFIWREVRKKRRMPTRNYQRVAGLTGWMSGKATAVSSSATQLDGRVPLRICQKVQSVMVTAV